MALRLGQKVPQFSLPDYNQKDRKLGEFLEMGTTVIAFFPFAFSGVCDREMCTFRDSLSRLGALNGNLVGVSVDSIYALKVFAQTYNLQFPLLSDFNKRVSRAYGALHDTWVAWGYKGVSKRAVFVADKKGVLRYKWITDIPSNEPPYGEIESVVAKTSS